MRLIARKLGRRGLFLLLLGILWLFLAKAVWAGQHSIDLGEAVFYERLPMELRLVLWGGSAIVMIAAAFRRQWQPIGFFAAMLMPVQRAAGQLWSYLAYEIPGYPPGNPDALYTAATWLVITGIIWLVAGWDEDLFPEEK